jgi:hypothetical protein
MVRNRKTTHNRKFARALNEKHADLKFLPWAMAIFDGNCSICHGKLS